MSFAAIFISVRVTLSRGVTGVVSTPPALGALKSSSGRPLATSMLLMESGAMVVEQSALLTLARMSSVRRDLGIAR